VRGAADAPLLLQRLDCKSCPPARQAVCGRSLDRRPAGRPQTTAAGSRLDFGRLLLPLLPSCGKFFSVMPQRSLFARVRTPRSLQQEIPHGSCIPDRYIILLYMYGVLPPASPDPACMPQASHPSPGGQRTKKKALDPSGTHGAHHLRLSPPTAGHDVWLIDRPPASAIAPALGHVASSTTAKEILRALH